MFRQILKQAVVPAATFVAAGVCAQPALMDLLAEDVEFRLAWDAYFNDEAMLSIELCNVGTCRLFVANTPDMESFVAFVDFYVVFASGFGDLRAVNRREDGRIAPVPYIRKRLADMDVREVVSQECGSELMPETISCTLNNLADSLAIERFDVRYDEGSGVRRPDGGWRARELSPEAIAKNLSWYAEFGWTMPRIAEY